MNAFYEHHKSSIEFGYRCFDRILLNGLIQPFQQPERVLEFFNTYRDGKRVIRRTLTEIADQFHHWVINRSERWVHPSSKLRRMSGARSLPNQMMSPNVPPGRLNPAQYSLQIRRRHTESEALQRLDRVVIRGAVRQKIPNA